MNLPNLTRITASVEPKFRRPVPSDWTQVGPDSMFAWSHTSGLRVICSTDTMEDGGTWLHVSVSRSNSLPSWDDLKLVKDAFIGRNHEAVQVLPRDEDFVNLHPFCLHLWSPES